MTFSGRRELVVLIDEELVGERGNVKVVWLVAQNDGFVPASRIVGARSERLNSGPRVVWRTRVEIELARGVSVERVETRPKTARGSTFAHLTGTATTKGARIVRTRFVVGPRGVLAPANPKTRPTK